MSDPGVVLLGMSAGAVTILAIRTIANAFVRRRTEDRRIAEATGTAVSDERMARLEAGVESIAIEVERISEGQRFTTRLLTEQSQPLKPLLAKPGKFDTPH